MISLIAFDADDTLWHSENLFQGTQNRLAAILEHHASHADVQAHLHETEVRNIELFGYGIKGFTLSMVEAAIEISKGRVTAAEIHEIVMMGKAMLDRPMQLLDGVAEVLPALAGRYPLYMITKGDHMDQRNKIEKSGLAGHFTEIEIVLDKGVADYRAVFDRHGVDPATVLMVGNSIPSDILPILELGGRGVFIPYAVTASFERHDKEPQSDRFHRLAGIGQLPALLDGL
ncbi:MAG: HAD family hydrolase [Alphaproteobacteria bacterium]|jgi:putative hydrolase of the HAD superfamily|nr:HAD family hydrolase [Alphaproteobacteria bacterium]MDP6563515.1 HAD family hydrolase [Alphaproteobacteria bacterium]